jgi:cytoskeletal protein CcmA (bactofilin family)
MNIFRNGKLFNVVSSGDINISGGKIRVNGKEVEGQEASTKVTIVVEGAIEGNLKVDVGDVEVKGYVGKDVEVDAGNISVEGDVKGNVEVDCGNISVHGSVTGSVSCDCGNVEICR